jgi:diguanylate cyclase (GGDEF)-like protein
MYDPLVVDTFIRVHRSIAPEPAESGPPPEVLDEIAGSRKGLPPPGNSPMLEEISASADEMLTLYELARALAGQVSVSDAGDVIAKHLRRLIPCSLCVFYLCDTASNELDARHVVGESASLVRGIRIPLGQRLSGWVAANRQTISNSDPVLDLGDTARSRALPLRSCISTPLVSEDELVGVLSLYSEETNGFNEDHRRIIEVIAQHIAHMFRRAIEFGSSSRRDSVTGLPYLVQLDQLIRSASNSAPTARATHALLFVDIVDLEAINMAHGRATGDDVLRHVALHARRGLRVADILFRNTDDELVAFLTSTDTDAAQSVANRIRMHLEEHLCRLPGGASVAVETTVTVVCVPQDGMALNDLLAAARRRDSAEAADHRRGGIH